MSRPTLVILTHSTDQFRQRRSLVKLMIPRWRAMGLLVEVATEQDAFIEADVALLHVGQSLVPDAMRRLSGRYPRVLNGSVLDIRKRTFSRIMVDRQDVTATGPVIVKTDWNYAGSPEFVRQTQQSLAGRLLGQVIGRKRAVRCLRHIERRRSWRRIRILHPYVVYGSPHDVPTGVWRNPNLVVERFMPERQGDLYSCRHWLFMGDAEVNRRTISRDPMVKLADRPPLPLTEPVPEALRRMRRQLGFDYGKFDYGVVNGEVVLYDTNRTPGSSSDESIHEQTIDVLSRGLLGLLDRQVKAS